LLHLPRLCTSGSLHNNRFLALFDQVKPSFNSARALAHLLLVPLLLAVYFLQSIPPARANETQQIELNIAELPLSEALHLLLQQANIQLLYKSSLVANRQSRELKGSYTIEKALSLLLAETDLKFKRINHSLECR